MNAYNTLYDEAAENYGLITTEMAERNGISGMGLVMPERRERHAPSAAPARAVMVLYL